MTELIDDSPIMMTTMSPVLALNASKQQLLFGQNKSREISSRQELVSKI